MTDDDIDLVILVIGIILVILGSIGLLVSTGVLFYAIFGV